MCGVYVPCIYTHAKWVTVGNSGLCCCTCVMYSESIFLCLFVCALGLYEMGHHKWYIITRPHLWPLFISNSFIVMFSVLFISCGVFLQCTYHSTICQQLTPCHIPDCRYVHSLCTLSSGCTNRIQAAVFSNMNTYFGQFYVSGRHS